jgi:hypothetical protein
MADATPTPSDAALYAKPGESFGMLTKVAIVIAIIALVVFAVYAVA